MEYFPALDISGDSHLSATNFLFYWTPSFAPALPHLGAVVHVIHLYYRYTWSLVIQCHRNRGAIVAGQSHWSVSRFWSFKQEHFFQSEFLKHYFDYIFSRYFLYGLVVKMALYRLWRISFLLIWNSRCWYEWRRGHEPVPPYRPCAERW
jgi:hypothetical protein